MGSGGEVEGGESLIRISFPWCTSSSSPEAQQTSRALLLHHFPYMAGGEIANFYAEKSLIAKTLVKIPHTGPTLHKNLCVLN